MNRVVGGVRSASEKAIQPQQVSSSHTTKSKASAPKEFTARANRHDVWLRRHLLVPVNKLVCVYEHMAKIDQTAVRNGTLR